ncbi:hypothetical protein [Actinomadura flavalba]|uniref:hypothetical protein n=1 Tax=Actinomadura flavalba TaxID=1120938 RepID=UPI000369262A|nr:hypothetical protein [Actinomadura flavalba]
MSPTQPRLMLPALRDVYATLVREAEELPGLPHALQAEVWTSARLGGLEAAAPHAGGRLAALGDLMTCLRAAGTPGARVFLRTLAAIGPDKGRAIAGKAAAQMADVPLPAWAGDLGDVTAGLVWLIQEGPLDGDRLVCEFRYPEGRSPHAVAVRLSYGDIPSEVVIVGDVPALMTAARQAMQAELCVVQPYSAAAVGPRLRTALEPSVTLPEDVYPAVTLARQRLALLP